MATFTRVHQFTKDLVDGVHNLDADTLKILLTNTAPVAATTAVKADLTEISAGNGYSAGGPTAAGTTSVASGVAKLVVADTTITASGGPIGPFRYVVLYNDTPTDPADPVIAYADYGSSITLANGESILIDFDDSNGAFTIGA